MAGLQLFNLSKRYGEAVAVDNASLDVADGELLVLLGPSGCGKTTTLRMVAGFVEATSGRIVLGGADITHLPPWKRNAGLVFQNYALFPHLNVAENVAFGLEMRKMSKADIAPKVAEALRLVRLDHLSERLPRQLSGGQQQRVALARALAFRPDILLLDEPLSNLDAKLRLDVRIEIRELQRKLGLTTIMVTHDQEEALTMADRLAVMSEGHIRQIGTQQDLYERPANRFVADFVGRSSFIEGHLAGQGGFVSEGGLDIKITMPADGKAGHRGAISLRPERVLLLGPNAPQSDNVFDGEVTFVSYLGAVIELRVALSPKDAVVLQMPNRPEAQMPSVGERIQVGWARSTAHVFTS